MQPFVAALPSAQHEHCENAGSVCDSVCDHTQDDRQVTTMHVANPVGLSLVFSLLSNAMYGPASSLMLFGSQADLKCSLRGSG